MSLVSRKVIGVGPLAIGYWVVSEIWFPQAHVSSQLKLTSPQPSRAGSKNQDAACWVDDEKHCMYDNGGVIEAISRRKCLIEVWFWVLSRICFWQWACGALITSSSFTLPMVLHQDSRKVNIDHVGDMMKT
nr:hypothetical protein Itr_chr15CG03900 [Ipomoea trifida]